MSREGAGKNSPQLQPPEPPPTWVRVVYIVGLVAATIVALRLMVAAIAAVFANDVSVPLNLTHPTTLVLIALVLVAGVIWVVQRRQRR